MRMLAKHALLLCALFAGALFLPCQPIRAEDGVQTEVREVVINGEVWEEIVTRRRKVTRPAAPIVRKNAEVAEPPKKKKPAPPEPPVADAASPRRLVRYFCKAWKDRDYKRMYWAMTPDYRKQNSLKRFTRLFEEDREMTGGLVDENIVVDDVKLSTGDIQVTVDLLFKYERTGKRRVKAVVTKDGAVYRMRESAILPLDMDDL